MDVYTLDFETEWSDEYTIRKMGVEDYVTDPRFREVMVSVKKNNERTLWFSSPERSEYARWLSQFPFARSAICAHNTKFDGLILQYYYGIVPALYLDTLSMARPILRAYTKSQSLAGCAEFFNLGIKGREVEDFKGISLAQMSLAQLEAYARYNIKDTDLCRALYLRMRRHARVTPPERAPNGEWWMDQHTKGCIPFPNGELRTIDRTMRMYIFPEIVLNGDTLKKNLAAVRKKKADVLAEMEVQGVTKETLRSNDKFAAELEKRGITPPMKPSPASLKKQEFPPKMTFAFSKTDEAFKQLQEEFADDLEVSTLLNARISEKSTQEETRTETFLAIWEKHKLLRVDLNFGAAHTWRYGGAGGTNMQNPPNVDKSPMRYALEAPPGKVFVNADQAQIEARLVSTVAGQWDLVEAFRRGDDIYSMFASDLYGRKIDRKYYELRNGEKFYPDQKEGKVGKEGILGLGFEMGGEKFRITLAGKAGVVVDLETAKGYVTVYRTKYPKIPDLWKAMMAALRDACLYKKKTEIGNVFRMGPDGMEFLYNDTLIAYPELRAEKRGFSYRRMDEKSRRNLFGGKATENGIQKLARDIVMDQDLTVADETGQELKLQNHDALVYIIDEDKAEGFAKVLGEIMAEPHRYIPECPLNVEIKIGKRYGDV